MMSDEVVIIEPDEDGIWVATCPGLPGCISQGRTREEAAANLAEAVAAFRECLARRGECLADCLGEDEP
jgi:predicted RNase H-like HicB family nuclease